VARGPIGSAVLIVHADSAWRRARAGPLREGGAVVGEADGAEEARQALAEGPVDVVVLGVEPAVMGEIRAADAEVPVLCLAPAADVGSAGADLCLPESAGPAALVSGVQALARLGRAERAAAEMERWRTALDAILHQMPTGVVVFDGEAEIILTNVTANRILLQSLQGPFSEAFAAGPEVYRPDGSRYAPEEVPGMRALRGGETVVGEQLHLRRPDGEERIAAISATPLRDAAGEITGAVSLIRDITEQSRAEQERAQQARLLEAIQESVPVGLAYLDRKLRFVRINSTLASLAGLPEAETVGHGILDIWENPEPIGEALVRARDGGESFALQEAPVVIPRRPEIGTRYLDISGAPVAHDGRVEGIVVAVSDVTGRVEQRWQVEEAERAWSGEAQLLSTILENTDNWLAYLDRELRFVRVNDAFVRGMGVPADELVGRPFGEVFAKSADLHGFLERARDSGKPQRFYGIPRRLEHRPEQGRLFLHIALFPVGDEQGAVRGIVISMLDVTRQTATRNRMLAAERARAELAEHLGDEISHRVKNNLAMVSGLLQMQVLASANPEVATALREAVARVQTFARLHEQMYAARGGEVEFLAVLRRIAEGAKEVFGRRERVAVSVVGEEVTVSAPAATNLSVIANELLTNALKHGAPGEDGVLRVEASLRVTDGLLQLRVQNSGNPVPVGFDVRANAKMGMRLVLDLVVTGYHGHVTLRPANGGTVAQVTMDAMTLRRG
jgi:PAS domain S-box-containing protein